MEKFQNKYRIPSARLLNWDYGANGAYFITICTHKMQCFFGEIVETPIYRVSLDVSNKICSKICDKSGYKKKINIEVNGNK
ncbi:hypothetical protein RCH18_003221 [Flavobacterium sp. PL11]|uniref:hypothetical protein n=1 Tax=Flavobacterium sp. PL11 TaxID=3071717 RepID=UPI002E0BEEB0|nr:hypothetical protein [Flavobacterium sp. PL11]